MNSNHFNSNLITSIKYYLRFGFRNEYRTWQWMINYYLTVIFALVLLTVGLFYYFQVLPPGNTTIASGQKGSTTEKMSESFKQTFSKYGLQLTILPGEGRQEGFEKLEDTKSPVNASFYIAGHIDASNHPDIMSLGSVSRAPLWLFYRGDSLEVDDPRVAFKNKKIAIGLPGTATNSMFRRLFSSAYYEIEKQFELKELSYEDAEKQLSQGTIDAMFIIYAYNTQLVQNLIKNPDIQVFDFKLADAYIKKYPNLEKTIIPRGSFDIVNVLPKMDVTVLSTSITLLTEKGLHPAIQWAFLLAARQYNRHEQLFFSKLGEFPKDLDYDSLPLSPVAERYYATGVPQFFSTFPLWLASLIDEMWIKVLAFFILVYPILIRTLGLRSFASTKIKNDSFNYLRHLKLEGQKATNVESLQLILHQVEKINKRISKMWCSAADAKDYIELSYLSKEVMQSLRERLDDLSTQKIE